MKCKRRSLKSSPIIKLTRFLHLARISQAMSTRAVHCDDLVLLCHFELQDRSTTVEISCFHGIQDSFLVP